MSTPLDIKEVTYEIALARIIQMLNEMTGKEWRFDESIGMFVATSNPARRMTEEDAEKQ